MLGADGTERRVPVEQLRVGDRFVVRPGEKVATDGVVEEGTSAVDAVAADRRVGPGREGSPATTVAGASVNAGGRLVVRATRVGADTALAQIARLVTEAQSGKAPVQRLADRVSGVFVPVVIGIAVATLGFWIGARRGVDVRVHRRRRGADHRLPVRARPRHADRAAGRHRPRRAARPADQGPGGARVHAPRRHDRARQDRHGDHRAGWRWSTSVAAGRRERGEVLRLAGALEDASEHPIARAIAARRARRARRAARRRRLREPRGPRRRGRRRRPRRGRRPPGAARRLGDARSPPSCDAAMARRRARRAAPRSSPAGTARCARVLVVADTVKPTSAEAVASLKALGLRPVLLTGDNEATARAVAAEVGIDEVIAEVLPGRQGGRRPAPAGRGPRRRDGRRRRQRRAGARAGRPRPRDRHRHRRRDRGLRPHARLAATCAPRPTRSGSRARRCARSSRTSPGRSATTSPRCRSPRPGCSTR